MNIWKLFDSDHDLWCFIKLYFDDWYKHEMTFHCFERTKVVENDGIHRAVKVWFDDECKEFVFMNDRFGKADYYDFVDCMSKLCPEKTQEV